MNCSVYRTSHQVNHILAPARVDALSQNLKACAPNGFDMPVRIHAHEEHRVTLLPVSSDRVKQQATETEQSVGCLVNGSG